MSDESAPLASEHAPTLQGLDLFEQYEGDGSLLVVTSDASALELHPGDFIVRRPWATSAKAVEVNRAAPIERSTRPGTEPRP